MAGANDQHSLEELMRRARAGDQRAYSMLFAEITPILRAFIGRRLGGHADTEDVVQNILLSIHRAGHTYDSDRPFKVWMFAIARHRLNDYLRESYKKAETVDLDAVSNQNFDADVTNDIETREYLRMMLDSLPEKQRRIITMMKVEGQSVNEVAKKMNMSPSAVKVAAHRAYKALALKAEGME